MSNGRLGPCFDHVLTEATERADRPFLALPGFGPATLHCDDRGAGTELAAGLTVTAG